MPVLLDLCSQVVIMIHFNSGCDRLNVGLVGLTIHCRGREYIGNVCCTLYVVSTVRHVMQRTVLLSQFCLSVRLSVCLSVRLSLRRVYCDKTK